MSKFFVEDNMFINNGVFGYYIGIHIAWFTSGSYVIRNEVADCYIGILVGPIAWKALLKYNHVHRNIWGIVVFLNVYEVIIRENTVGGSGNVIGIALILVTDVDVLRNDVLHNEQGIIAFGAPWFSLWSYDIRINRNWVHHNDGNGIWVHGCYDFRMKYNTVHDNGWGAPVGGSGIEVLASMNGRVGGRWRARNEVYDNAGDGIAVRVSNEIMVKKNRVFDNGGYALFWFHMPSGWPAPLWTEPGRVRFIGNKNNFGHLLVPVIMSP